MIERGSELLWEHMLEIRRKQFKLEGALIKADKDKDVASEPAKPIAPLESKSLPPKKRGSGFASYCQSMAPQIISIREQNVLRIAEAHLFIAPLSP